MSGGWRVATASARGAMHDRKGLPNQDAVATTEVGTTVVAAVADGHGGDRYVRSDIGSRIAVDVACAAVARALADQPDLPLERLLAALPSLLVERWTALVAQDVASRPFDDEERARAGAPLDDDPAVAYGATLLLAIATDEAVGVLQLGDGDVVVGTAGGNMLSPVPTDDRLIAGQTTSLCLPTAVADFRQAIVPSEVRADLVLLASDGYGNSFADAAWREQVTADLRHRLGRDGVDAVQSDLPRWLTDSARAAGDDTTVAVLSRSVDDATVSAAELRRTSPAAATRPTPEVPPRDRRTAASTAGPGERRAVPVAIATGLVAALAGIGVGFAIGRSSDSGGSAAPSSSAVPGATSTSSTATEPATTTQVVGPKGATIVFNPDPANFDARIVATGALASTTTQFKVGDDVWSVTSGSVNVRIAGGKSSVVGIDSFTAASLVYAGGYIWVIDADEGHMAAVDPATHQLVENGVKRIRNPLGEPEQSPAS